MGNPAHRGRRQPEPAGPAPGPAGDALARVPLDELLAQVQYRVSDVLASQERLRSLVDAVTAVGSDLHLHSVLGRITDSACRLVGARYGALALLDATGRVTDFITHGLDPQEREMIGQLPTLGGILGLPFTGPIRLTDLGEHPAARGFPPHHPPMTTFLGVPLHLRKEARGILYLTEKEEGVFTEEDEKAVVALAVAASVAIENARLFDREQLRQRWLTAASEITDLLLGEVSQREALQLVVRRVCELCESDFAAICLVDPAAPEGDLVLETVRGLGIEHTVGQRVSRSGIVGKVIDSRQLLVVDDVAADERLSTNNPEWASRISEIGYGIFVPLTTPDDTLGVLIVAWRPEAHGARTAEHELRLVETFAGQAALALQRVRGQEDRARLMLLEDHDRIARDLHDLVIQRLFAAGMRLQTATQLTRRPELLERLNEAIDALDQTSKDIRTTIFGLHAQRKARPFRDAIHGELEAARSALGYRPRLMTRGPVEHGVPNEIQDDLLAVLREALSNAARHASATSVEVEIRVDREVAVTVTDDGAGIGRPIRRSGLANMAARAHRHRGSCDVRPGTTGGTVVDWRVPLPRA